MNQETIQMARDLFAKLEKQERRQLVVQGAMRKLRILEVLSR